MEKEIYQVKVGEFEGPFWLILDLVEKRKLFINDVSLADITEDYLKRMSELGGLGPAEVASFVSVASTLILIKSKSLLPNLNLTEEEEGDIKSLEERLRLYELFIRLGIGVKSSFGKRIIFLPLERKNTEVVFLPDSQITRDSMMGFVREVLGRVPKKTIMPEVEVRKVVSLEEMIDKLTDRIKNTLKMGFKEFSGHKDGPVSREEKTVVIVGFLAMLELIRQGILNAVQESNEDITIEGRREEKS